MSIAHRCHAFAALALLCASSVTAYADDVDGSLNSAAARSVDFDNDLQPVFTRFGCTSGPCHGKARGQGGFQLSLLGFDSDYDYDAIVKEGRGRRLFPAVPERSLLLTKPSGLVPHGGGRRFSPDSAEFQTILSWIQSGAPRRVEGTPQLTNVAVSPSRAVLKNGEQQQLVVTATYSDGSARDVTRLSAFQSNESPIAAVTETGGVTAGQLTGEAAVMARFMGQIAVCEITIPREQLVREDIYRALPQQNFIDGLVWKKLQRLNITPSGVCDDTTFLRRATTDICGRLPRVEEVQAFLNDASPDKRSRLIDRLVEEPDFADHWANKWMDLLRPNPYRVGIKTVLNYDQWIRQRFHQRMAWDQFVTELVTARGGTWRNGAVTLFRDRRSPDEVTTMVSQLFLGIRLDCAKCHHHPFEKWGQDDFYSFAAYFAKLGRKGRGVSPPISGSEEFIYAGTKGSVTHPATGEVMSPRPLFGDAAVTDADNDPREVLAAWMTSRDNPYFAQVMANRVWADLMSRGLVEPVDDLRATNPPSNAELLESLGRYFRDNDFSLTELVKVIAKSHVYQLSSLPNETNVVDTRNYSRHYRHRLRAEVLRDGFSYLSGVEPSFDAMPPGTTARQIWTHRTRSYFLDAFGRPDPNQDPPCERTGDSTVVQSLHLMNSDELHRDLVSDKGRVAALVDEHKEAGQLAVAVYQLVYARNPTPEERVLVRSVLEESGEDRRAGVQDLIWAMVNSPEFVFQN